MLILGERSLYYVVQPYLSSPARLPPHVACPTVPQSREAEGLHTRPVRRRPACDDDCLPRMTDILQHKPSKSVDTIRGYIIRCSGLQTVASEPANKGLFRLTFGANKLQVWLTIAANEPTFRATSLQTAR
jgi:hypothetical protein